MIKLFDHGGRAPAHALSCTIRARVPRRTNDREKERGFSLIDTLVACGLVAISVLGLHSLAVTSLQGGLVVRQNDTAIELAAQKIEGIKRDGYDAATIGVTTESHPGGEARSPARFARTTTISAGPLTGTKQVQVTVTWQNRRTRTMLLTTVIAPTG